MALLITPAGTTCVQSYNTAFNAQLVGYLRSVRSSDLLDDSRELIMSKDFFCQVMMGYSSSP